MLYHWGIDHTYSLKSWPGLIKVNRPICTSMPTVDITCAFQTASVVWCRVLVSVNGACFCMIFNCDAPLIWKSHQVAVFNTVCGQWYICVDDTTMQFVLLSEQSKWLVIILGAWLCVGSKHFIAPETFIWNQRICGLCQFLRKKKEEKEQRMQNAFNCYRSQDAIPGSEIWVECCKPSLIYTCTKFSWNLPSPT